MSSAHEFIENENQTQTLPTDLGKLYELFLSTQLINQATKFGKDHQPAFGKDHQPTKLGKDMAGVTQTFDFQNLINWTLILPT